MKKYFYLLFIGIGMSLCATVNAQEAIDDFDITLNINKDTSIDVTERITYNYGTERKHGIYREVPYKYKARGGNYNLKISDPAVTDGAGDPFIFVIEDRDGHKNIKIGDAQSYVTGQITYVISYKIKRAINYFSDHDELYWNATGNLWEVPIRQSRVTVVFPGESAEDLTRAECFAGSFGSANKCDSYRYKYSGDKSVEGLVFTDDYLEPGEGLTIVAGFARGVVEKPSWFSRVWEIFKDNPALFLPLLVFISLYYIWYKRGRDPKGRKTIIALYAPPDSLTPAEVGTIIDDSVDHADISADIINLAVRGYLRIERVERTDIFKKVDYDLEKLKDGNDLGNPHEQKLFSALFPGKRGQVALSVLKNDFYADWKEIKNILYKDLARKNYFVDDPGRVRKLYTAIGIVFFALGVLAAFLSGILSLAGFGISGLIIMSFGYYMPVKTPGGALVKDRILGLKEYLAVAEKDRLKFHNAPEKNPGHFEALLPFAMVLGVEKEWARQFKDIYDRQPDWYNEPAGANFSSLALTTSLRSFKDRVNADLSSRPSSASGGGSGFSGGFSGGGFGGGGGRSW